MKTFKNIFKHPNKYNISSVVCFIYAIISIILHNLNNYNGYNKSVVVLSQITILIYSVILLWKSTIPSPPQEDKKENKIKPDFSDRIIGFYTCFLGYFSSFALITPFMLVIDSKMSNDMSIILFLFVIAMSSFLGTTMIKKGKKILRGKAVATESPSPSNNDSDEYVSEFINDRSFKNVSNAIPSDAKSVQSDNIVTTVSQKSKLTYMSDVDKEKLRQWRISKGYISQIDSTASNENSVTHGSNPKFIPNSLTSPLDNYNNVVYITVAKIKNNVNVSEISGSFIITTNKIIFRCDSYTLLLNKKEILSAAEINGGVMIHTKNDTHTFYLWSSHIVIEKIYEFLQKPIPPSARLDRNANNQNNFYLNEPVIHSCSAKIYSYSNTDKVRGKLIITSQRMVFENREHDVVLMHKDITNVLGTSDVLIIYSIYGNYMLVVDNPSLVAEKFNSVLKSFEKPTAKFKYNKFNLLDDIDEDDISCVDGMEGHDFEYWCADLLERCDFDDVTVTRASGDQGVDIIAVKDGTKYAIQCKNYYDTLGNKPIQEVCTGRLYYDCDIAVVMTNSHFTPHAIDLAKKTGVLLWDRDRLQDMMDDAL